MSFFKQCFFRWIERIPTLILAALYITSSLSPTTYAEGLNCETSFPLDTLWQDYFDDVGDFVLFHDDECGMSVPLDSFGSEGIGTTVKKELRPFPHRYVLGLFLKTDELELLYGASVTVFRATEGQATGGQAGEGPETHSVVELRVEGGIKGAQKLRVVVRDGDFVHSRYIVGFDPRGTQLEIDVTKSTMALSEDGVVEVRLPEATNEAEPVVFADLDLWSQLPAVLETGVIATSGTDGFGRVVFQPGELTQQYFVTTPQVPPM